MSSYHLAPANIPAYIKALSSRKIVYLLGYASSLYALAQITLEKGLEPPPVRLAISNAEPLYAHQRETIARAFNCEVRDTYGMSEIVCGASECQQCTMHIWPEAGIIETLREEADVPVAPGQVGRFVCTGLLNKDMPLIRYEVGDRGVVSPDGARCVCGRALPQLERIEGRLDDVVITPDGRRIGRLDPVFKADLLIREAQIIQESAARIRVLLVPAPGYRPEDSAVIAQRLKDRVGDMDIRFECVDSIPRTSNGKFRGVVSEISRGF
jgi:phenylacetate-CoA ligase